MVVMCGASTLSFKECVPCDVYEVCVPPVDVSAVLCAQVYQTLFREREYPSGICIFRDHRAEDCREAAHQYRLETESGKLMEQMAQRQAGHLPGIEASVSRDEQARKLSQDHRRCLSRAIESRQHVRSLELHAALEAGMKTAARDVLPLFRVHLTDQSAKKAATLHDRDSCVVTVWSCQVPEYASVNARL